MKNKKYLSALGLGCVTLLLTGCGSGKTLTCKMDLSDQMAGLGTMKTEIKLDYDSNGEKSKSATVKMEVELTGDDVTSDLLDTFESSLKKSCDEEGTGYKTCETKKEGNKVILEGTVEPNSLTEDSEEDKSLESAKKYFEGMGYTCE